MGVKIGEIFSLNTWAGYAEELRKWTSLRSIWKIFLKKNV